MFGMCVHNNVTRFDGLVLTRAVPKNPSRSAWPSAAFPLRYVDRRSLPRRPCLIAAPFALVSQALSKVTEEYQYLKDIKAELNHFKDQPLKEVDNTQSDPDVWGTPLASSRRNLGPMPRDAAALLAPTAREALFAPILAAFSQPPARARARARPAPASQAHRPQKTITALPAPPPSRAPRRLWPVLRRRSQAAGARARKTRVAHGRATPAATLAASTRTQTVGAASPSGPLARYLFWGG